MEYISPFEYNHIVTGSRFIGREREVARVKNLILQLILGMAKEMDGFKQLLINIRVRQGECQMLDINTTTIIKHQPII